MMESSVGSRLSDYGSDIEVDLQVPHSSPPKVDNLSDYGSDLEVDPVSPIAKLADTASEYGSDFDADDEALLEDLLKGIAAGKGSQGLVLESIEEDYVVVEEFNGYSNLGQYARAHSEAPPPRMPYIRAASVEIEYDIKSRDSWKFDHRDPNASLSVLLGDRSVKDTRSPLQRFRSVPRNPLSVTDMVSPAWCELQYWFTLTKHGRKPRTEAMKAGSAVHKVREEEVMGKKVEVDLTTREDRMGLKIWNVIQGLRVLRAGGTTRELEVWGIIDGEVINGVIDEVTHKCPDVELEMSLETGKESEADKESLPPNQQTLDQFFSSQGAHSLEKSSQPAFDPDKLATSFPKVYLSDVKTRRSLTFPPAAQVRPAQLQLMLYHKLLTEIAQGNVDASKVFARYRMEADEPLSDSFIAQLSGLDNLDTSASRHAPTVPIDNPQDTTDELLANNSLNLLWSLMITEYSRTLASTNPVSPVLSVEYRHQPGGELIGTKSFLYNKDDLQKYVKSEMQWWRGERDPVGVDVEDAFKCRTCEFAEQCKWRQEKVDGDVERHRLRMKGIRKSQV